MQIMREIALFSGKIYTAGTNFTRPPVVTVATNLNSDLTFEIDYKSFPLAVFFSGGALKDWSRCFHWSCSFLEENPGMIGIRGFISKQTMEEFYNCKICKTFKIKENYCDDFPSFCFSHFTFASFDSIVD